MNTETSRSRRFAVAAVVPGRREAGVELRERVTRDDPVELGVAERAEHRLAGLHEQLGAGVRAFGDRRERDRARRPAARRAEPRRSAQGRQARSGSRYQSRGSTNRWIVPPQVRPTANASSSE